MYLSRCSENLPRTARSSFHRSDRRAPQPSPLPSFFHLLSRSVQKGEKALFLLTLCHVLGHMLGMKRLKKDCAFLKKALIFELPSCIRSLCPEENFCLSLWKSEQWFLLSLPSPEADLLSKFYSEFMSRTWRSCTNSHFLLEQSKKEEEREKKRKGAEMETEACGRNG